MIEMRRVKLSTQYDEKWIKTTKDDVLEAINTSLNKIGLKIVLADTFTNGKITFHIEPITEEEANIRIASLIASSKKLEKALTKFAELAKGQNLVCTYKYGVNYDDLTSGLVVVLSPLDPKDKGKLTKLKGIVEWATTTKKKIIEEYKVMFSIVLNLE